MIHATENKCPKCDSKDILVGAFPLECLACGWNHLNKYACGVCGEPATAHMHSCGTDLYACRKHPFTDGETKQMLRRFVQKLR